MSRDENDNWISVEESEKDLSISAIIRRLFFEKRTTGFAGTCDTVAWLHNKSAFCGF